MPGADEATTIRLSPATKEKLHEKKRDAGAEDLSDDAFLSKLLDIFDPRAVELALAPRRDRRMT